MTETAYPASFMRGGTSKGLMFVRADLPADRAAWDAVFRGAMGSPDVDGRQLNGMGGGLSSLSKVCVVERSTREDADVDYTFAQVNIATKRVDYMTNCGNMSAAVGPFALDQDMMSLGDGAGRVRIFNTNTSKLIHATFPVHQGRADLDGDFAIPGVSGTGAPIRLDFLDPGGATTGRLLPTSAVRDCLVDPSSGAALDASMVDAANACVFLHAEQLGLSGVESPDSLTGDPALLERLAVIRAYASVAMGIAADPASAKVQTGAPFIAMVSPPQDYTPPNGRSVLRDDYDLAIRVISHGQPHRAVPLTVALCAAVAAAIPGSVPNSLSGQGDSIQGALRLGTPSGVIDVAADVAKDETGPWRARSGAFYRTARRLFDGRVWART